MLYEISLGLLFMVDDHMVNMIYSFPYGINGAKAIMNYISFKGLILASLALGFAGTSMAVADDEDLGPVVHPSLELYASDASDPCVADSLQIRITAQNIYPEGILKLELYNGEDGFLFKKGRLHRVRVAAEQSPMQVCINVPAAGTYAVAGYHDLDGNRKLKKKWDFTPREPYGLSNNPVYKSRRLPKFEEAAFTVGEKGADIEIAFQRVGKKKSKKDKS
jgi:uncharacterized protein (DUF2141 family)